MPYCASSISPSAFVHQVAHEVLDVATDVAGFAKLGGVGFDEGHADQLGDVFYKIGFSRRPVGPIRMTFCFTYSSDARLRPSARVRRCLM